MRSSPRQHASPASHPSPKIGSSRTRFLALSPVAAPLELSMRDTNFAPAFMPASAHPTSHEGALQAACAHEVACCRDGLGERLFEQMSARLKRAGIESQRVDADASLRVVFTEAGLATRPWSSAYEPRVDIAMHLSLLDDTRRHVTELFHYGANASGDTPWSAPADPRHVFSSEADVFQDPARVVEACELAVETLSARVVQRVLDLLGTSAAGETVQGRRSAARVGSGIKPALPWQALA